MKSSNKDSNEKGEDSQDRKHNQNLENKMTNQCLISFIMLENLYSVIVTFIPIFNVLTHEKPMASECFKKKGYS